MPKKIYKKEFNKQFEEHLKSGKTYKAFAKKIGVEVRTLQKWEERYPEFKKYKESGFANYDNGSSYKTEYDQMLIDHLSKGYSIESFAGRVGVTRDCLYKWFEKYPSLKNAKQVGMSKNIYFWEDIGIKGTKGELKNFNCVSWKFNMSHRFKWSERVDQNINQTNSGEITVKKRLLDDYI